MAGLLPGVGGGGSQEQQISASGQVKLIIILLLRYIPITLGLQYDSLLTVHLQLST